MSMKICTECKLEYALETFPSYMEAASGHLRIKSKCRDCLRKLERERSRIRRRHKCRECHERYTDHEGGLCGPCHQHYMSQAEMRNAQKVAAKSKLGLEIAPGHYWLFAGKCEFCKEPLIVTGTTCYTCATHGKTRVRLRAEERCESGREALAERKRVYLESGRGNHKAA